VESFCVTSSGVCVVYAEVARMSRSMISCVVQCSTIPQCSRKREATQKNVKGHVFLDFEKKTFKNEPVGLLSL